MLLYGSNLGDREAIMKQAAWEIHLELGEPVKVSSMYETAAWGITDQDPFLNCVITYNTSLRPLRILELIKETEIKLGRVRYQKWGPRTIDIDILFYDNIVYESPELQIPHPQLHKRRFVLAPLNEIRPEFRHPVLDKTIRQLYNELDDDLEVVRL